MSPNKIQRMFGFYKHKIKNITFSPGTAIIEFHRTPKDNLCCPICKNKNIHLYGKTMRIIRDLPISNRIIFLKIPQNKIYCSHCGIHSEKFSFIDRYARHTRRFEQFVYQLCHFMTIVDVANSIKLSWDEVKYIDRKYLNNKYKNPHWKNLRILGVDEIALAKGHKYLTIVVNLANGQVVYVGKERKQKSLEHFFKRLGAHRCRRIKAIAMDLWKPYIAAVKSNLPKAKIVFDKFHLLAALSKAIDKVRRKEYIKASQEERTVIKGSKYILLKHKQSLSDKQQIQLAELLSLNFNLNITYILKDDLYQLWKCTDKKSAEEHLINWIKRAQATSISSLKTFAKTLIRNMQGILNYFEYPISTAKVEGINNKIKVLKRKAYGFRDIVYFTLKIYDLHNLTFGFG